MRNIIELGEKDIQMIIADYFDVYPQDVEIIHGYQTIGYGMNEHDKPKITIHVTNIPIKDYKGE